MVKAPQFLVVGLLLAFSFTSCNSDKILDQYYDFSAAVWHVDSIPTYSFNVDDATIPYQVRYNLRHGVNYPFRNLYLTYYLEDDAGNLLSSDLQELHIFDAKSGKPLGRGMGDIFDISVVGIKSFRFETEGRYHLKIKQFMRREELPYLMSLGITVEKNESEE